MKIGFDIDGVLADFNTPFSQVFREMGYNIPPISDTYPDVWDYPGAAGVPDDVNNRVWADLSNRKGWWASLPPYKETHDTIEYLQDLRNDGAQIYFITSRPGKYALDETIDWLSRQGFINPNVTIANSAEDKKIAAQALGLGLFLDDKPANCEAVAKVVPNVFILDRPWNKGYDSVERVYSPIEALQEWEVMEVSQWGV